MGQDACFLYTGCKASRAGSQHSAQPHLGEGVDGVLGSLSGRLWVGNPCHFQPPPLFVQTSRDTVRG